MKITAQRKCIINENISKLWKTIILVIKSHPSQISVHFHNILKTVIPVVIHKTNILLENIL